MLASTLSVYLLALGHQGQYDEDGQHMASLLQSPGGAACWGKATSASLAYGHLIGCERGFWKGRDTDPDCHRAGFEMKNVRPLRLSATLSTRLQHVHSIKLHVHKSHVK